MTPTQLRPATGLIFAIAGLLFSSVSVLAQSTTSRSARAILGRLGSDTLSSDLVRTLPRHRLFSAVTGTNDRASARRDTNAWAALRSTKSRFVAEGFPLENEAPIDLVLQPFRVVGPNTKFVIGRKGQPDIPFDFDSSSISLFRGSVLGRPGSHVYLALSDRMSSGYIDLGPGRARLHISSKDATGRDLAPGDITIYEQRGGFGLPAGVPVCGVDGDLQPDEAFIKHPVGVRQRATSGGTTSTRNLRHLELAVDTDYEYFFLFGDETAATEYLILMYGAVSDIYMRDVDTWVEVVFTRIWTDPDDLFNGPEPLIEDFAPYWSANMGSVHRDAAQLFSGRRDYPFGGQAYLTQLCNFAYGVVGYAYGFFPDPSRPSPYNYDVSVTAHELGHTSGTGHTHQYGIDSCDLANTAPQRGPIMSYCGQTWSGMNSNHDNYFHTITRDFMDDHISSSSCIVRDCNMNGVDDAIDVTGASPDVNGNNIPDECEDCNGNGVLDPTDIAEASFDLNNNGIPDECEPDCNTNGVPDERDIDLGTSPDLYGNRIPDECETDCNNNGVSDYTEIQLNMPLDVNRNAALDACEDCNGNGLPDLDELVNAHFVWVASGLDGDPLREFHPTTGVRSDQSTASVRAGQDVIIAPDGKVLVSSAIDDRVMKFSQTGIFVGDFVSAGSGGLDYPTGMFMAPSGSLLVASRNTNSVLVYDGTTGAFQRTLVGAGAGGLVAPFGLTLTPSGQLLVTSDNNEVLRFDVTSGVFLGKFVKASRNGGLSQPRGLSFKADGNLLVASFGTDEVLEYDGFTGRPLGKWAQVGTADRITQDSPWGIRVGPNGHVYVARTGENFSSGGASNGDHTNEGSGNRDIAESHLTDARMFEFNVCTGLFRKTHIGGNDHGLEFATGFAFVPGSNIDCNFNQLTDDCDIASGFSSDTNGNGVPDECELDCNGNGVFDELDLVPFGTSFDCNCNRIPDECELASGTSTDCNGDGRLDECDPDCNGNGEPDSCDIFTGFSGDCDSDGVPDSCQPDCNNNTIADACDLLSGFSVDCNGNAIPDACDTASGGLLVDVDFESGLPSGWTTSGIFQVTSQCQINPVCDGNTWAYAGSTGSCSYGNNQTGQLVSPAIQLGPSDATLEFCSLVRTELGWDFTKVFVNGTEVFSSSGENGVWQTETIDLSSFANQVVTVAFVLVSDGFVSGTLGWQVDNIRVISGVVDCNNNTIPDDCEPDEDCDANGTRDICDIGAGTHTDCNANSIPDVCESATDCDTNGVRDFCDLINGTHSDCNGNAIPDLCESAADCDTNGVLDFCDLVNGTHPDCNDNLVPDVCDISSGSFPDADGNGVPDVCEQCSMASQAGPEMIGFEVSVKNRMLSITGGDPDRMQAVTVTFAALPPPFDLWNGAKLWASQPTVYSQAGSSAKPLEGFANFHASILQCDGPEYIDLSAIPVLHLFHEGIVPNGIYLVELIDSFCDVGCAGCYAPVLEVMTSYWGDTIRNCASRPCPPPDGFVNIDDVLALLGRFVSDSNSIIKPRADLEPGCLDLVINISDVLRGIGGFSGLPYGFTPSAPSACGSTCIKPAG